MPMVIQQNELIEMHAELSIKRDKANDFAGGWAQCEVTSE